MDEGSSYPESGELAQVIDGHWVAVGIDEAWDEVLALSVDVMCSICVGPDDRTIDDDAGGMAEESTVKHADIVERYLSMYRN